jgi:hypothetical protein
MPPGCLQCSIFMDCGLKLGKDGRCRVVSSKCLLEKVADSIFHAPPELHESEDFTRPSFSRSGENRIGCESCGPALALLYGYKRFQPRGSTHGIVKSKPPHKATGRRIQSCPHGELTHADHKLKLHRDPRRWFSTRQAASFRSNFAPDDLLRISGATSPKKKPRAGWPEVPRKQIYEGLSRAASCGSGQRCLAAQRPSTSERLALELC